ncbi:MAG: twin-arginine translocation signal domain-containing protein, partial [Actinomycetota bacterium]
MSLRLSRRDFLVAAGLAPALAACGSDGAEAADPPQLVHLFSSDHVIAAGRPHRELLPVGELQTPVGDHGE